MHSQAIYAPVRLCIAHWRMIIVAFSRSYTPLNRYKTVEPRNQNAKTSDPTAKNTLEYS